MPQTRHCSFIWFGCESYLGQRATQNTTVVADRSSILFLPKCIDRKDGKFDITHKLEYMYIEGRH